MLANSVQEIYRCAYQNPVSLQATLTASFDASLLHVVVGPEYLSPILEAAAAGAAGNAANILGRTAQPGHLVTNLILIGDAKTVAQALALAKKLDTPRRQVRLHIKMDDVDTSALLQLGITYDWSTYQLQEMANGAAGAGTSLNVSMGRVGHVPVSLVATLQALETKSLSKGLLDSTITLLDREKADILIGSRLQFPKLTGYTPANTPTYDIQEVRVGAYIQVAVEMASDDDMVLVVYPQISSISGFLNVNGAQYPQVVSREAQTSVRLHDKETLVVGGLLSDTESKSLQRIPILGQIPVLGNLFTYREHAKQRTDLIMMITPEVLPLGYQDTNPQLHPETGGPALKLPGY